MANQREDFADLFKRATTTVHVKEWGKDVVLSSITAREGTECTVKAQAIGKVEMDGKKALYTEKQLEALMLFGLTVLHHSWRNGKDVPLFTVEELTSMPKVTGGEADIDSQKALEWLAEQALKFNGYTDPEPVAVEKEAKN